MNIKQTITKIQKALLRYKGPALISGYDTELYRDMLGKWERRETTSYSQVCSKKREVLWMNFQPVGEQLTFEGLDEKL